MTLPTRQFAEVIDNVVARGLPAESAVDALRAAESRHRTILYHDDESRVAPGVFRPLMTLSADRAHALTRSWEQFDRAYEQLKPAEERTLVNNKLGPFVRATGLWMAGDDFSTAHLIIFQSGEVGSWSADSWDRHMANWAVATRLLQRDDWTPERFRQAARSRPNYQSWVRCIAECIQIARGEA